MEYENVLLIGGPRDGEWISVEKGLREIRMVQRPSYEAYRKESEEQPVKADYVDIEYRRVPFHSDRGFKGSVFVFGDIDPMVALIEGYRKS